MSAEPRVLLNVGGRRFEAYQSTLTRGAARDSLFARLLAPENRAMCKPDADGCFFFDRNPDIFSLLLDYLRGGSLSLPACSHYSQAAVRVEAEYFGIEFREGEPKQEPRMDTILKDGIASKVKAAEKAVMDGFVELAKKCDWKPASCKQGESDAYSVTVEVPVWKHQQPALENKLLQRILTERLRARGVGDVSVTPYYDSCGTYANVYAKVKMDVQTEEILQRLRE